MKRYISDSIRKKVKERAGHCCEYCRIHQDDFYFPFEIDHIISLRHGGKTVLENLALSCNTCNRMKAADIGLDMPPRSCLISTIQTALF